MNPHWYFVGAAWGLAALLFAVLVAATLRRQAAARRRLAALDGVRRPRAGTGRAQEIAT
jgi:heme exporter protein CcmD